MRLKRKKEHIEDYLRSDYTKGDTLLSNVFIEHNALPELNFDEIDTSVEFLGKKIDFPLMINSITGGSEEMTEINENLSRIAKIFNIPIAVGSQTVGIEKSECSGSFEIVREIVGPDQLVIGNISARAPYENILKATEMINADAMQLHLNVAQEICMGEGERNFKGTEKNIAQIIKKYKKPIIVKEVGFGISKEVATRLKNIGVKYIDISGTGGTNFIEIEDIRNFSSDYSDLYEWGVPTAKALIDCRSVSKDLILISSGGIKTAKDIVNSIVLGGEIVGISGEILMYLMHGGLEAVESYLNCIMKKTKMLMLLLGKKNISELRNTDYTVYGKLKELIKK